MKLFPYTLQEIAEKQEFFASSEELQKFTKIFLCSGYYLNESTKAMTRIPANYYNNDAFKYRYLERLDKTPDYPDIKTQNAVDKFFLHRNRSQMEESSKDKLQAGIGAFIGTALPMAVMMRRQGIKNPLKLKYGLKEMLILSATSVMGGVGFGMIGNDTQTNWNKSREGVFQFMNAAIPTWLSAATLRWCETTKGLNNNLTKIFATAATILIGMQGAASVSNIICDPKDKRPDRKLTFLDSLANIDDLIGVLVLAKVPIVEKLHIDKVLPAIYAFCGYRAGKSN